MRGALDRIRGFYFDPQSPFDLGISRAIFYTLFLWYYSSLPLYLWGGMPREIWKPIAIFEVLRIPVLPVAILQPLYYLWLASMALAALGLLTRAATVFAFLAGTYLVGLSLCWGYANHVDAIFVIVMAILAVSRCGDAFSIDAVLRDHVPDPSGEYRWPIRGVWTMLALIFFAAGVAKLRVSGWRWAFSNNLLYLALQRQYISPNLSEFGVRLMVAAPWIPKLLAAATLVIEVGYPLALFSRRLRFFFVPGLIFTVLGFKLLVSPDFRTLIFVSLFWIPWSWLIARARQKSRVRPAVLYDGTCTLCRKSKRVVEILDPTEGLDWIPMQDSRAAVFGIPREVLADTMVMVRNGKRYDGFLAWKQILWRHPFFWLIAALSAAITPWSLIAWVLFFVPFTEPVGHAVYRWVAANRYRVPGSTCEIPVSEPPGSAPR